MRLLRWLLSTLLLAVSLPASAAERVALLIGCGKYRADPKLVLTTPQQDMADLATLLGKPELGFEVIKQPDATLEDFARALREFKAKAAGAKVALVYFSGHGIEFEDRNYLLPVDASLDNEGQLDTQTVDLERVMRVLGETRATVKLAIMDCCRDNPFTQTKGWLRTKSSGVRQQVLRALGEAEIPQATLVVFAASAGRKAAAVLTATSRNSPFTEFLLEELPKPGLALRNVFENVHDRLSDATKGRQIPAIRTDNALSPLFRLTVLVPGRDPAPDPRVTPTPSPLREEVSEERLLRASKDAPFTNGLNMEFVPVPVTGEPTRGQKVLFCRWETRRGDFASFVRESGYDAEKGGAETVDKVGWEVRAGAGWRKPGFEQDDTHPVVCVNWDDSRAFCAWLSERERAAGKLPKGWYYRLPSDHEWSCAVGIGQFEDVNASPHTKSKKVNVYPWGRTWPPPRGAGNYAGSESKTGNEFDSWETIDGYRDQHARTAPTGSYVANKLGLYDLGGNAWEWCEDLFDGSNNKWRRVIRGAAWCSEQEYTSSSADFKADLLSSRRLGSSHNMRHSSVGFRIVLSKL